MPDVIITGLPRSGTTVVAALIDYLPNSVCFNSPEAHIAHGRRRDGALPFSKWIVGDYIWRRAQLLRREPLPDFRAADGSPLMDNLADPKQPKNDSGEPAPVFFTRPKLKGDFILGMKHNLLYTCLLPTLAQFDHFKIIAVIRHPLDVIGSWKKHGLHPLGSENPPGTARYWPEALAISASQASETDRMVQIYELHLQRYHELRKQIHIVKYEDLVDNPLIISELFDIKTLPANARKIKTRPRVHRSESAAPILESLRKYGVFAKEYYRD